MLSIAAAFVHAVSAGIGLIFILWAGCGLLFVFHTASALFGLEDENPPHDRV
jgi:hypothetical protein